MRIETAELVDPVLYRTWQWRDAASTAQQIDTDPIRAELKQLLSRIQNAEMASGLARNSDYLGLSYALACWIDEIMTADRVVGEAWNENKLEGDLFGTNDRAWMFWRQAELAETLGRTDDLAVFFLCVQLGFTGQFRSSPEKLAAWTHRTRIQLGLVPELTLPFTHDLPPATDAAPLRGGAVLQRASYVGWAAAVLLLPTLSYLAVVTWAR